jgi:D-alanyl-lipoteichoic acid acyltransferase DltB (MBOAT superfamily)
LSGLIKKMVFADRFAIVSDAYFNNVAAHPGWLAAWSGAFAFAMQLFFDFSGYTDIARGCAKLFGFEFPLNFQRPYLAANVVEFWQRWHITLSSWVRDYLFLPLTRGTRSRLKIYFALALTMVLLGLWHGASWNFVVWGVYFGVFVVVYRIFQQKFDPGSLGTPLWQRIFHPFKVTATFLLVIAAAAFFRPKSLHDMVLVLSSYVDWRHTGTSVLTIGTLVLFFVSFLLAILEERRRFITRLSLAPAYVQVPAFVSVFLVLELFSVTERVPFIYFQF